MLLYAWDLPQFVGRQAASFDESPDLIDLLARVLLFATKGQLRRGLHRDYIEFEERLRFLRGRVDLLKSARKLELVHGSATCRYDELHQDILANQIVRSSLIGLSTRTGLNRRLRQELRTVSSRLAGISVLPSVTAEQFARVRISRNNAGYRLLLQVCRLVWDLGLPTEDAGEDPFAGLLKDELRMSQVFESFLRNFYTVHAPTFRVGSEWLEWPTEGNRQHLPRMRTDVCLSRTDRRIVIDVKYYAEVLVEHRGHRTARSSHLYQLFAYLRTQEHRGPVFRHAEGMLVYPTVNVVLDERYRIQDHTIRIATLDLAQPWREVEAQLLGWLKT